MRVGLIESPDDGRIQQEINFIQLEYQRHLTTKPFIQMQWPPVILELERRFSNQYSVDPNVLTTKF